jgi:beta-ureidopropionase / N-carbamoyl-L-amino-acid hydrolase
MSDLTRAVERRTKLAADLFDDLARNTRVGAGICRASYGEGEGYAHRLLAETARSLGLKVTTDAAANTYMTLPGREPRARRIVMGSHLDSVLNGGNFDGAAGVIAGLTALAALKDAGYVPPRDLTVMGIRAEESAWFGTSYIGSRAALGSLDLANLETAKRSDTGRSLAEHMAEAGADPDALRREAPAVDPAQLRAYMEVHIEQGPVLQAEGFPVGLVTGIRGNVRFPAAVALGEYTHVGVPRSHRRDAAVATALFISGLDRMADTHDAAGRDFAYTVGKLYTDGAEHQMTRVAGRVDFSLDVRSVSPALHGRLEPEVRALADTVARKSGVSFDLGRVTTAAVGPVHPDILARLARGVQALGLPERRLPSAASHDAAAFAAAGVPTGMIFIRNDHGSHNPQESMELDDFVKATRLLAWWLIDQEQD